MTDIAVKALTALTYRGRALAPGRVLLMDARDAVIAARQHRISLSRQPIPPDEQETVQPIAPPVRQKRRYRRRDLTAEP